MPSPRPILLTGSTGQVGSALLPLLRALGPVAAPTRVELDLSDADSIRSAVRSTRPRWIINPAAYTAVDRAESEPDLARAINADAPGILGEEARALGIPLIHLSTDYVFNGEGDRAWREADVTGPLNVYGVSKLAGEEALRASGAAHLILRTSWVYAATGQNFLRTMLRLGRERPHLRVVDDQHGTPTAAKDLAALIAHLIRTFEQEARSPQPNLGGDDISPESGVRAAPQEEVSAAVRARGGLFHAAGSGDPTTWCGFARAIFAHAAAASPGDAFAAIAPIPTAAFPTPARRPGNSRLDCTELATHFGYNFPDWRASLGEVMAEALGDAMANAAAPVPATASDATGRPPVRSDTP